jgi:NitT/TauT family transport system permease protein
VAETPAAEVAAPARPAVFLTRLRNSVILFRLLLLLAFLAAWEILADTHVVDPLIFSHPLGVLDTLRSLLAGEAISGGSIYDEIKVTVGEMATGFLIGSVAAIALGFYLGRSRFLARVLQPFILASYGVPIIAIAPIFILVLGIGYPSKIGIATITSFFVVFFQTFAGVGAVPEELPQLARIMGASGPRIVRQVLIPASLPFIFAGLRMAVPFSMTGAVIGEFVASSSGLGWYIVRAAGAFDAAGLFAGLILMLVIVWVLGLVVAAVERRLLRWQPRREAPSGRAS